MFDDVEDNLPVVVREPMWHRGHYNAVALEIRESFKVDKYAPTKWFGGETMEFTPFDREFLLVHNKAVMELALSFARRFKRDRPDTFEPLKFLNQCSPEAKLFPLSELWTDEHV